MAGARGAVVGSSPGRAGGTPDGRVTAMVTAARELADPVRLAAVDRLRERPRTAAELADELAVSGPRLGNHLARLRAAGFVAVTRSGRHATYRLADERVAEVLAALARFAAVPTGRPRGRRPDGALAAARTCYDHLAGRLGIAVFDQLVAVGALVPTAAGADAELELGPGATRGFRALGVDPHASLPPRRRPVAVCLDWTERRPHLGGALGAAVLDAALERGWVTRADGRVLTVTPAGRRRLPRSAGPDHARCR